MILPFKLRQSVLTVAAITGLVALQAQSLQLSGPAAPDTGPSPTAYGDVPLAFEPNQGQAGEGIDFLVHHGSAITAFSGTAATTILDGHRITLSLDGAADTAFAGQDKAASTSNYFLGNDQAGWHRDIPNFQTLVAADVYPGIDLRYHGTNAALEHDFVVHPGAAYQQIAFSFAGQDALSLDPDGAIVLKAGSDRLQLNAPTTYQTDGSATRTVPSRFELRGNTVTVALAGPYDPAKPLVIDPTLVYSTYLGGSGTEGNAGIIGIAVDPSGNAYVTGHTASTDFPTASPVQGSNAGGQDVFVSKISADGSTVAYSTYFGGTGTDSGGRIAVDTSGNAYIAGETDSTDFPTFAAFQGSYAGGTRDAFLMKLDPSGAFVDFSTYLGGNGAESLPNIVVDIDGNVYLAGNTTSTDFPTVTPFQASNGGSQDLFVSKFSTDGLSLIYSTYLGGSGSEGSAGSGIGLAVDSAGYAYVTGSTDSTNFPTASPFQAANAGGVDIVVTKLGNTGSTVAYSTYLGGSGTETGGRIALDSSGNAYVTGSTTSTNFPTASPYQAANAGGSDLFVTKLNAAGSALVYSTYLGGSGSETGGRVVVDSAGNAYLAGATTSTNFPIVSPIQATNAGGADAFTAKLNAAGSALTYSTYLGGSGTEGSPSIAQGLDGDLYLAGTTTSTNFPTLLPYQAANAGGTDAFVTKLTEHTVTITGQVQPILTFTLGSITCDLGQFSPTQTQSCTHTMSAGSNAANGYVISYIPTTTLTSGADTITAMSSQTSSVLGTEQFGLNLKANTAASSHTAADFGADPSGGAGSAMTGYELANQFKFSTGGGSIAHTTGTSATTSYTVSFIANMASVTEAGSYATPITYNIVASY